MKTSSAKAKGRNLQQIVRDAILATFPEHLVEDDVKSTAMGQGGEDIQLSPVARKFLPLSIECKSRAKLVLYNYYDQARVNARGHEPVVVVKGDRRKPLVIVDLEHYLKLWRVQ